MRKWRSGDGGVMSPPLLFTLLHGRRNPPTRAIRKKSEEMDPVSLLSTTSTNFITLGIAADSRHSSTVSSSSISCGYRVRAGSAMVWLGGGGGGGGVASSSFSPFFSLCSPRLLHAILEPRRYSFKYARKPQHLEMRQPSYIHDKRHGVFSNEHNVGKARRGLPYITPLDTKHVNLWDTDTDATTNRFFRSYVFGQRELHQLLGRPHGFESNEVGGKQGDSLYELETDQRWKGMGRSTMQNIHWEPGQHTPLYPSDAHVKQALERSTIWNRAKQTEVALLQGGNGGITTPLASLTEDSSAGPTSSACTPTSTGDPRALTEDELLGPSLVQIRDIKSVEHCEAWFNRLSYLIQLHYDAVGDTGEFRSRHTQHVHEFFVHFHDAIRSFDFQDAYLFQCFQAARPAALEDVFGIFIEMEANYVHPGYCPRCSLPFATTRYCGEGDEATPFRKHRGRWAPHQQWGKEWWDVVCRRAEALWYRATEDPYFGHPRHTQRQVEAMLRVYAQTHQRAKAIDFFHRLRGSVEYLTGHVSITDDMTKQLDTLMDTTPHPHVLTGGLELQRHASGYTGSVHKVPHSPLQLVLDLKKNVFRRQQKEEGVVRIPPASWRIVTDAIVPYKLDPQTKRITNWREVKEGIETAFLDPGLPREAYTAEEWRAVSFWRLMVNTMGKKRAVFEAERQKEEEEKKMAWRKKVMLMLGDASQGEGKDGLSTTNITASSSSSSSSLPLSWITFPTAHWYQVLDTSLEALAPFASALWKGGRGGGKKTAVAHLSSHGKEKTTTISSSSHTNNTDHNILQSGLLCVFSIKSLLSPQAVPFHDSIRQQHWMFDTTSPACYLFGAYESGEVLLCVAPTRSSSSTMTTATAAQKNGSAEAREGRSIYTPVEVVVIGVHTTTTSTMGKDSSSSGGGGGAGKEVGKKVLYAMYLDPLLHKACGFLPLGSTAEEVSKTIHPEGKDGELVEEQEQEEEKNEKTVNNTNTNKKNHRDTIQASSKSMTSSSSFSGRRWGRQCRLAPIPFIDAIRAAQTDAPEEGLGQIIGVRQGQLYVQWRLLPGSGGSGGARTTTTEEEEENSLDRGVAVPLGTPSMVRDMYTIKAVRGLRRPLREPPSWLTPFRNDFAEERLREAIQAPFQHEAWASLIPGKYTPKVKRFGYTQHSTQDDFQTKEYQDRLLSRQFFNQPQQFQVLPERQETSVRFGGKWENQRVCGFPSVDRHELENGWAPQDLPISAAEEAVVEQAIRDISGDRPGNYIKRPTELANLQLNESWWTSWHHGWQEHNQRERAFHHPTEQAIVDPSKLPFQGKIPPFGTSYGIGERIREIVMDYSKGFGLGPTGHSSTYDQVQPGGGLDAHVRAREERRVKTLGFGNALVRLFDEKISRDPAYMGGDIQAWALAQSNAFGRASGGFYTPLHHPNSSSNNRSNPDATLFSLRHGGLPVRSLLLSLQEWREKGQPPSYLLQTFLQYYLKDEVEEFNAGLPPLVPKLRIQPSSPSSSFIVGTSGGGDAASASSFTSPVAGISDSSAVGGQIWMEVDRSSYGCNYQQQRPHMVAFAANGPTGGSGSGSSGSSTGVGGEGSGSFILDLIHRACTDACLRRSASSGDGDAMKGSMMDAFTSSFASSSSSSNPLAENERLRGVLLDQVTSQFQHALSRVVNKGISPAFISQYTASSSNSTQRGNMMMNSATPIPYVRLSEVIKLLISFGVSVESIELIRRGLRHDGGGSEVRELPWSSSTSFIELQNARRSSQAGASSNSGGGGGGGKGVETAASSGENDLVLPVSTLLSWSGPNAAAMSSSSFSRGVSVSSLGQRAGAGGGGGSVVLGSVGAGRSTASSSSSSSSSSGRPLLMVEVFDALSIYHDGYMADVRYIMERNRHHPILRQEFMQTFLPIFQKDGKKVQFLYEAYTQGQWVPNVKEAIEAFVAFLGSYATKPEAMRASVAVDYFETVSSPSSAAGNTANRSDVVCATPPRIRFLPPELGPFQFENTLVETIQTRRRFEHYHITAGPNAAVPILWIAPDAHATAYCTPQPSTDLAHVRREKDYGLAKALENSVHAGKIKANNFLRSLLTSPFLLTANFNRFFHRVMPMLSFFQGVLQEYQQRVVGGGGRSADAGGGGKLSIAEDERRELSWLLENESLNPAIEMEFRRNAERYWRNVLEGRHGAGTGAGGGNFSGFSSSSFRSGGGGGASMGRLGKAGGGRFPSSSPGSSSPMAFRGGVGSPATGDGGGRGGKEASSSSSATTKSAATTHTTTTTMASSSSSTSSSVGGKGGGRVGTSSSPPRSSSPSSSGGRTSTSPKKTALENLLGNVLQKKKRK